MRPISSRVKFRTQRPRIYFDVSWRGIRRPGRAFHQRDDIVQAAIEDAFITEVTRHFTGFLGRMPIHVHGECSPENLLADGLEPVGHSPPPQGIDDVFKAQKIAQSHRCSLDRKQVEMCTFSVLIFWWGCKDELKSGDFQISS